MDCEKTIDKITIIIPVYNPGERLQVCVESVRKQSYENIEILLVDDGSTDGSSALCDSFAESDPRVKVFHKENGGVSTARNKGLDEAEGRYIVFADADDYMDAGLIEAMHAAITEADYDIVIAGYHIDYSGRRTVKKAPEEKKALDSFEKIRQELVYLNESSFFDILWNKMYRADFIEKADVRFEVFARTSQDLLFNADLFLCDPKVLLLSDTYYYYYKGLSETIVSRYHAGMYEIMKKRREKIAQMLAYYRLDTDREAEQWLAYTYVNAVFNSLVNIYRKNAPFHRKQRLAFIRELYGDEQLKRSMELNRANVRQFRVKLFTALYTVRAAALLDMAMASMFHVRQIMKRCTYH